MLFRLPPSKALQIVAMLRLTSRDSIQTVGQTRSARSQVHQPFSSSRSPSHSSSNKTHNLATRGVSSRRRVVLPTMAWAVTIRICKCMRLFSPHKILWARPVYLNKTRLARTTRIRTELGAATMEEPHLSPVLRSTPNVSHSKVTIRTSSSS